MSHWQAQALTDVEHIFEDVEGQTIVWRNEMRYDTSYAGRENDPTVPRTDVPRGDDPTVAWLVGDREVVTGERTKARCGRVIRRGELAGRRCPREAGQGTAHYGAGSCIAHGGAKTRDKALGAWIMGHAFAAQLDVNPWEALLMAVRIAAGKVAYIESVLASAKSDLELEGRAVVELDGGGSEGGPGGPQSRLLLHPDTGEPLGVGEYRDLSWWVEKGELWHDRMARCAKMAVDAGIAAWQVERVEAEAAAIATVLNGIIDELGDEITESQVARLRARMRSELLQLDAEQRSRTVNVLEGVGTPEL